uniref:PWWP domain-containing protein n=1 Tax=Esox lucius TaxID=8010 RepID=A0A6Q2Y7N5_ESOLU
MEEKEEERKEEGTDGDEDGNIEPHTSNSSNSVSGERKRSRPVCQRKRSRPGCQRSRGEDEETDDSSDSSTGEFDQWVQCSLSVCGKWRRVQRHVDLAVLPEDWTCSHSTGPGLCEAVEESWSEKEGDIINSSLFPGSLVWAQQSGYPWWPAMIERDPDTRTFCQLNLKKDQNSCRYHVTYLGNPVSRAWVCRSKVREYSALTEDAVTTGKSFQSFRKKLKEAIQMATQAQRVPLKKRLSRFGFWTRRASDRESSESEFAEAF